MYDVNGNFLTALPTVEAELLVDSGHARRISRPKETPLRITLLAARRWQPTPYSPTSGCTAPACITAKESELNALGAIRLASVAERAALRRVQAKICESETA
jgi:hypothetical protein